MTNVSAHLAQLKTSESLIMLPYLPKVLTLTSCHAGTVEVRL